MDTQQQNQFNEIFAQFQEVLFPCYKPGCSSSELLKKVRKMLDQYAPLKEYLYRIDSAHIDRDVTAQVKDSFQIQLIRYLNEVCSFTHRKEVSLMLVQTVTQFKKNLASLPVGRLPITVSHWGHQLPIPKLTDYAEIIKKQGSNFDLQIKITRRLDQIYQQQKRIPVLEHLLLKFPKLFLMKLEFQQELLSSDESTLPMDNKIYLGMIAACTYGCTYLWNYLVKKFLKSGGDPKWIQAGIEYNGIPTYIKNLSQMSLNLAFQFHKFCKQDYFNSMLFNYSGKESSFIEGLYILAYYQSISCLCLVAGLVPQNCDIINLHIPLNHKFKPSLQSFEAMLHKEFKQQMTEQEKAVDFVSEFNIFEGDSNYQNFDESPISKQKIPKIKKIQVNKKAKLWQSSDQQGQDNYQTVHVKFNKQGNSLSNSDSQQQPSRHKNTLRDLAKEDAKYQKLRNMKTIQHIKAIHHKYISNKTLSIEENYLLSSGINNQPEIPWKPTISGKLFRKNTTTNITRNKQAQAYKLVDSKSQKSESGRTIGLSSLANKDPAIIYASDWTFQGDALQEIQNITSLEFVNKLKKLLHMMRQQSYLPERVQTNNPPRSPRSPKNVKARNMKIYYEMINNYLCQSIDYTKLVGEGLCSVQKNFIKMVTKSPFLFNAQSFAKMRAQLQVDKQAVLKLLLQVTSYKLQLSMSLITAMYAKFKNLSEELE